jgi:hypothetical protein
MRAVRNLSVVAVVLTLWLGPTASSRAEGFGLWLAARGDYFSGSSDLFNEYDSPFGGGLELGLQFGGFTTFAEALLLGNDQFLFTLNGGVNFEFGEAARFQIGIYTGPVLFKFPEQEVPSTDLSPLTPSQRDALLQATGFNSLAEAEAEFAVFAEEEKELSSLAFGWNLGRLRLAVDVELIPMLRVGLAAQLGYHLLISGDDVAAGAKNEAIDRYAGDYALPTEVTDAIRDAVGAEPVDRDNLDGFNWDTNLYLRLEFF